jgi:hypothetical protein
MNRPTNYSPPTAGIPAAILCSAATSDRPAGVSALDALTHEYEIQTNRKSTLPAATVAKLEKKLALQELGEVERLIRNGAGPGSIITQRGAREAINHLREQLGRPAPAVAVASTPTASAPSAARPSQAPAKPSATSKARTAAQFLALDSAATKQLIITGCSITRGENIRHEIRSLFEGMEAGPDRTAFYQKFRSILTFR